MNPYDYLFNSQDEIKRLNDEVARLNNECNTLQAMNNRQQDIIKGLRESAGDWYNKYKAVQSELDNLRARPIFSERIYQERGMRLVELTELNTQLRLQFKDVRDHLRPLVKKLGL